MIRALGLWACMAFGALPTAAQIARDPTTPPPEAGASLGHSARPSAGMQPMSVIVLNGQPRLVVGTRLVAPGQMVGEDRLERITETEVWMRSGKVLRKLPLHTGVQRTIASAEANPAPGRTLPKASACSTLSSSAVSPAGCTGVQTKGPSP